MYIYIYILYGNSYYYVEDYIIYMEILPTLG